MKRITAALLTIILIITSVMCLSSCNTVDKTITIGYTDYPPMNYEDENGALVGFDTELATKMF